MSRNPLVFAALFCLAGIAPSCGHKTEPSIACPRPVAPVTYTASVEPLLTTYCVPCHSVSAHNRQNATGGINFDTYDEAVANALQAHLDIVSGRMPPDVTLDANQRCVVDAWIASNYLE